MTAKAMDDLRGPDAARLKALRSIKNSIIGNKAKKKELLHLLPSVLDSLATSQHAEVLVQV
jgi:hypothetical protein